MSRFRLVSLSLLMLHFTISYSQNYFNIYSQIVVCPDDTAEQHEFIFVKRNDNKESAKRINERMLKEIFWDDDYYGAAYDKKKDSSYIIRKSISVGNSRYEPCPKVVFENSVIRNDSCVFGLNHFGEGCGAYCEPLSFTYNFISKTGEEIKFRDLFESKAYYFIDKAILQNRRKAVKEQIDYLKKELASSTAEDAERNKDAIEMYERCIYFHEFPYKYESMKDTSLITESNELRISKDNLTIRGDRCAPHALRAIDDLGDFENTLSYSMLKDCFVKKYFNVLLPGQEYSNYNYYLYTGKMNNKIAITFLLMIGDSNIKGLYFYDSQGIIIPLTGKKTGEVIELFEKDEKGEVKYKFSLKKEVKNLSGTWLGLDTKNLKELSIVMEEVNDFIIFK